MNNGIVHALMRKEGIAQAAPQRHSTVRSAAQTLSRRNVDGAITELLNEALGRVTALCYERDADGRLCNVDPATGRALVPLPWGKAGYRKWGLTPSESNVMRMIMFTRQNHGVPLFFFDRSRRAWYLNLSDYAEGARVLAQFNEWEISSGEYRLARSQIVAR